MANHPNRSRTYWFCSGRGFANEYSVGIATTREGREHYETFGYKRIDRDRALREMVNRGDAATQIYAGVTINGDETMLSRFELAQNIRSGR